ncbi:MAG TPA: nucleotidyl transferase AbiEii/AbiGii toxin family protein [Bacteroidia bacterium]
MAENLYYTTVTPLLKQVLNDLMGAELFAPFRLVGGTSLSLQLGHRESVDIDLFTDADYGSLDFDAIEKYLRDHYTYVDTNKYNGPVGMGKSFFVGNSEEDSVKVDVFYTTEPFMQPIKEVDGIRLATVEEIIAMKLDVVQRGGRKKDFWDLHELIEKYTIEDMISLHESRYPYTHDAALIRKNFSVFENADTDFDPVCMRGKQWGIIKLDLLEFAGL